MLTSLERDLGSEFVQKARGQIWGVGGQEDHLNKKVDSAVLEVEEICRQHLK